MKVYFDARMIDHPGIGRYIRCLLPLMAEDRSIELSLLGNRTKIERLLKIGLNLIDFDYPIYSLQEQAGFLKIKKIVGNDILHVPHYNIPVSAKFNFIATVHDLTHIAYPEGASGRLAPVYMKFMINRILKSARAVICVSRATKNEILSCPRKRASIDSRLRGNDRRWIPVIYEGVDEIFTKMDDLAYLKSVKEKYKLPDKFILYVGSIRRHKNIGALLDSFSQFKKKMPEACLVMVGRLSQDIDIKRDGVTYLGEIESDRELAAIYNLASCLFNLSLYEGFGLTILEAQKCGLPVICSDIPVHKEIGGDGIVTVRASYIDQICDNLYNVLSNKGIRESLITRGLKNADRFDWHKTAQNTVGLYRKTHDEGSDSSRLASGDAGRGENSQCLL